MPLPLQIFVSCEHASNRIPEPYRHLFAGRETVLETHRGYDIGILAFAEALAAAFNAPLLAADVSRLIIDLNRSLASRTLFSEFTRPLPGKERQVIIQRYHLPYWQAAEDIVAGITMRSRQVLHLSVHSFTPVLNGKIRNVDIGLLYDPARAAEKRWCLNWQSELLAGYPALRIRRNYPYRGNADALVTALRKRFDENSYLGIEVEINQRIPLEDRAHWQKLQQRLIASLRTFNRLSAAVK
jgi:predicted N-formylglutamate amidohydrolase